MWSLAQPDVRTTRHHRGDKGDVGGLGVDLGIAGNRASITGERGNIFLTNENPVRTDEIRAPKTCPLPHRVRPLAPCIFHLAGLHVILAKVNGYTHPEVIRGSPRPPQQLRGTHVGRVWTNQAADARSISAVEARHEVDGFRQVFFSERCKVGILSAIAYPHGIWMPKCHVQESGKPRINGGIPHAYRIVSAVHCRRQDGFRYFHLRQAGGGRGMLVGYRIPMLATIPRQAVWMVTMVACSNNVPISANHLSDRPKARSRWTRPGPGLTFFALRPFRLCVRNAMPGNRATMKAGRVVSSNKTISAFSNRGMIHLEVHVMTERIIKPEPLTPESFAPFGDVLYRVQREPDQDLGIYHYWDKIADLEFSGDPPELAYLRVFHRAPTLTQMERHKKASQSFIPVSGGRCVFALAPPESGGEEGRPRPGDVHAFILDGSTGVNLHRGTWHWSIFPTGESAAFIMLVRRDTVVDDLEVVDLEAAIEIQMQ